VDIKMRIKEDSVALSRLAKEEIIKYITEKNIQPDEKLPSEAALGEMLGVSRYTVREALALLEQDKLVYKAQGKGTFVKKTPIKIESGLERLESISKITTNFGYEPGSKCLKVEKISPSKDMIDKLNIGEDEKVLEFTRIKYADQKVAAFCIDTVPEYLFKGMVPENLKEISMFEFLSEKYNIRVEYAVAEIIPTFPTKEMMKHMDVRKGDLFLLLNQIHYDKEGTPIIYSMDYFNPDVFKFKVNRII